ncbi:MAG: hypothetical protein Q8N62_08105 [Candidatus Omnitrophota bacterium]|nr:hypothetical protein [Candidatus Omnitrophota bacterium]
MRKKGMSVVEYSLLIAIVIAGLLAMQVYVKRAVSGRWKEAGDVFGFGRQTSRTLLKPQPPGGGGLPGM